MMHRTASLGAFLVGLVSAAPSEPLQRRAQGPWEQCGGIGWTGGTTCESGWVCTYSNDYYSQCLQSTGDSTPTTTTTTKTTATTTVLDRIPTIYLCGDSTMAKSGGGSGTEGWGQYLQYSFSMSVAVVSNQAIAGRSARSYTREGRFDTVINSVQSGDWVVIEFGHNDGGSLSPTDNGRTDCFGDGTQTCQTTYNGVAETVLTFPAYLKNAASKMLAKGAKVIFSTATPNNPWESGTFAWGPDRFYYYNWLAASQLGGPAKGAYFLPHGQYIAQAEKTLGASIVNANFPNDHTHTAPYLADVEARAFVLGLKCGTSQLGTMAMNSTSSLTSTFLGNCVSGFNSTVANLLR